MKINDFLQLNSFEEYKNIGIKLLELDDLPSWFYKKAKQPFNYNMFPTYCKLVNEYRMRYIEIEFNDDIVAFCFKVVQIIKTKQIKIFELPYSLNNKQKHINMIIKHMYNILNNQFICLSNDTISSSIDKENCNYYYNYDYYNNKLTGHYRRKHQFSRYKPTFELKLFDKLSNDQKNIFINIHEQWYKTKNNPASPKSFKYAINQKNDNYLYYIGYVKNIPCICGIAIKTYFGIYIIFEYSLDRVNKFYDTIVIYTSYFLSKTLSEYNIYKLGARKTEKGLIDFKERTSAGKIISYKININNLI